MCFAFIYKEFNLPSYYLAIQNLRNFAGRFALPCWIILIYIQEILPPPKSPPFPDHLWLHWPIQALAQIHSPGNLIILPFASWVWPWCLEISVRITLSCFHLDDYNLNCKKTFLSCNIENKFLCGTKIKICDLQEDFMISVSYLFWTVFSVLRSIKSVQ